MSKSKEAGRIDLRTDIEHANETIRNRQLCFRLKQTMPLGDEYNSLVNELFFGKIGEGSYMMPPLTVVGASRISIGKNVFIMDGILLMGSGGITIEDNVQLAANVQILSNNHDLRDREVITLAPVRICRGAWIGAGATILPGVTIGENAVVGAASVVTRDVAPNTIVAGNPAKLLRSFDPTTDNYF
ncbi:MAG: galactoside O-acetyltransferase [Muribaculaceae bacterium]|nr:galactoside O-acetyltransferase [Muribaculaceae bacterium]MDE6360328.1 galactoside O-acetyltransferase [Muribaculaceae bacterium]